MQCRTSWFVLAGAALGAVAHLAPAQTATVTYAKVVMTGDSGPVSGTFNTILPPSMNESRNVAFLGRVGTTRGVWMGRLVGSSYSLLKAVGVGDDFTPRSRDEDLGDLPNDYNQNDYGKSSGPGSAKPFSAPVISNNNVVATMGSYETGWTYLPTNTPIDNAVNTFQVIIRAEPLEVGSPAEPMATNNLLTRTEPGTEPPTSQSDHLWYYFSSLPDIIDEGNADLTLSRDNAGGTIAWYAKQTGAQHGEVQEGGIWCAPDEVNHVRVALEGETIDGELIGRTDENGVVMPDSDNIFHVQTMNDAPTPDIAFSAYHAIPDPLGGADIITGNIVKYVDDVKMLIAREGVDGTPGVGAGIAFSALRSSPVINNNARIAFRAQTDDSDKWGIWAERDVSGADVLQNVVYDGDAAPGVTGGTFTKFGDPVINDTDELAFVGRYEHQWEGQTTESEGVFRATAGNSVSRIAARGLGTPQAPNETAFIGEFDEAFGDPSMNDNGNIVFIADVDISHAGYQANLFPAGETPPSNLDEEAIFATDGDGVLRAVVSTGMTLADLIGSTQGDDRVLVNILFLRERSFSGSPELLPRDSVGKDDTLEGNASGHQDGRRVGVTNLYTEITENPNGSTTTCKTVHVAFLADFWDYATDTPSTGAFVAELEVCETQGGGGGCTTCLCSTDPNCMMGSTALGSGPDFNQNGIVDAEDVDLTVQALGYTTGRFDLNQDGIVDSVDVGIVYDQYKLDFEKQQESK